MGYTANAASAGRSITKKGMPGTLLRGSAVGFDPVTGKVPDPAPEAPENVAVVKLPPDSGTARGSSTPAPDTQDTRERAKLLLGGATLPPALGDVFTLKGETWTVEWVNTLSPGGIDVLHTVGVVRT